MFRPGSNAQRPDRADAGGAHADIQGKCDPGKNDEHGRGDGDAWAPQLTRGPAMTGNQASVPVYVAVTEGDRILDKHVYTLVATFPSNVDRVDRDHAGGVHGAAGEPDEVGGRLPVLAGFQLTPDELAANRARNGQ